MKVIICCATDTKMAPLCSGLVASIRARIGNRHPIGLLDVGLDDGARDWFAGRVGQIVEPGWDIVWPPEVKGDPPPWYRALTGRPFLPRHFPGYDIYLWIDADAWVQDGSVIDMLVDAAQHADVAIVPEMHPAYSHHYDRGETMRWMHDQYLYWFAGRMGSTYMYHPILNSGVFAARAGSPFWTAWAENYQRGIDSQIERFGHIRDMNDQIPLNAAVYTRRLKTGLLPASCNFMLNKALPVYDPDRALFLDPCPPHAPLHVLHLSGKDKDKPRRVALHRRPGHLMSRIAFDPARRPGKAG